MQNANFRERACIENCCGGVVSTRKPNKDIKGPIGPLASPQVGSLSSPYRQTATLSDFALTAPCNIGIQNGGLLSPFGSRSHQ